VTWGISNKRNSLRVYAGTTTSRSLILGAILVGSIFSGVLGSMEHVYGASADVTVIINRVIELDCSILEVDCPNDYYASVSIGGQDYESSSKISSDDFSPAWIFTRSVDLSSGSIPIVIELWDSDLVFDDQVDIDPTTGGSDLDLTFDVATGTWSGDVPDNQRFAEGNEGGNRAKIFFEITLTSGDIDEDGIPDAIELFGVRDESGNPIPIVEGLGFPMNPCRKTVAVEIDYMDGAPDGHTHQPLKNNALQFVLDAFNNAPVPAVSDCPYPGFPTDSGVNLVIDISNALFEAEDGYTFEDGTFDAAKQDNFNEWRKPYFHYAIWQHQGARGEIGGNDFYIGDAGPGLPIDLGGVFMHELGHNLGLHHGGISEAENCKPNYHSVMNYAYSHTLVKFEGGDPTKRVPVIDYSRSALADLNESNLLESNGVGDGDYLVLWGTSPRSLGNGMSITGIGPLDWDRDGIIDDLPPDGTAGVSVEADLNRPNGCGASPGQILHGFNDWENLDYVFRDSGEYADSIHTTHPVPDPAVGLSVEIREMLDEPPTITAPSDIVIIANTAGGATVDLGVPTVSDNLDPNPVVTNDAPSVFPLGDTTVTWIATDLFGNSASDTQLVTVNPLPVTVDIKPGDSKNTLSLKNDKTIRVAVISSQDFDASTLVDTSPLTDAPSFGGSTPKVAVATSIENVNGDGFLDLVNKYNSGKLGFSVGDTTGCLTGTLTNGIPIKGCDAIRIVR
jgi:hypothetical protein